jgi:hypothetical protein
MQPERPVPLEYRSTPPADPADVWPARRQGVIAWGVVIVTIWEGMVLLAVNVTSASPKPVRLIVVAMLIGPALLVLMLVPYLRWGEREHRRSAGLCLACGYALRGNLSGTCPECGVRFSHVPSDDADH